MTKYCIYRDRQIGLASAAQATENLEGLGCIIFNVWHKCDGCPNCKEMGDNPINHYESNQASAGIDMWPNYLKDK